jgi:hypothetical protein
LNKRVSNMEGLLAFKDLPVHKELPGSFYQFRFDGLPSPKRHWCLAGEIVDDSCSLVKKQDHMTLVQDRDGLAVPVVFLFEKDAPCTFRFKEVQKGRTLFVMYAERDQVKEAKEG